MRDARVTTLFEGTTEIHSIYPALLGVRSLERELRSRRGAAKFLYILKQVVSALVGARFDLRYKAKTPNRAARLAEANIRSVRRLLIFGLLHYGKDIVLQEFFLRRVSTLSMHAFAIMSVLKRLKGRQANGEATGTSDSPSLSEIADGRLLEFLIQEAKEARRENNRLFDKGIEKLNAPILKDLSSLE
jgi:acyl-CoA dehydrogenase family protein 9